jgi:hypothetical protein
MTLQCCKKRAPCSVSLAGWRVLSESDTYLNLNARVGDAGSEALLDIRPDSCAHCTKLCHVNVGCVRH